MKYLVLFMLFLCSSVFAKDWLFFVYLNADNNLASFADLNLKQMEAIGSTDQLDIVAIWDGPKNGDTKYCLFIGKQRNCTAMGELDMGNAEVFKQVFLKTYESLQPSHVLIDFWNHGSGWNRNVINQLRGISYDDTSYSHITTPQLGVVLNDIALQIGKKIDVVGYDACLMQMAEVSYEIRNAVDYIVGSEETEPGDGWDYKGSLSVFNNGTEVQPIDLSISIVNAYEATGYSDATMSVIVASGLDSLAAYWKEFSAQLTKADFIKARNAAQSFYYRENKDMPSFLNALGLKIDGFENLVPRAYGSGGIAIWAPYSFNKSYLDLQWSKDTGWGDKVKSFLSY